MKLNATRIREIAQGVSYVYEDRDGIELHRFNKEQEAAYRMKGEHAMIRVRAGAGMKFVFRTDSSSLFLHVNTTEGSSRTFFSYDVFADGKLVGYLDNFTGVELPEEYPAAVLPLGEHCKKFELGDGVKTVSVYLPWSVCTKIKEMSLEDDAFVEPVRPTKKMLIYGDSITQGYDTLRPHKHYAIRLAEELEAEALNKGIGGEVYFPELAQIPDELVPDYITVAYGTNDWSGWGREVTCERMRQFYAALSGNYPTAKIFVLAPIWRADCKEERAFGPFEEVEQEIREAAKAFENITVIPGLDNVPHEECYFADFRLHPNDEGFQHYFENVKRKIKLCKM